jgi:hypothetical protein
MGTEGVGILRHADAPHRDNASHSAPHQGKAPHSALYPACIYHDLQIQTHMKLFFAGATHAGQIHVILKTLLLLLVTTY